MSLTKGPYENHYYALGEPVRNIVKQGQELMSTLHRSWYIFHGDAWMYNGRISLLPPGEIQCPQSLGELCIEIAQDRLPWLRQMPWEIEASRRDIQTLREYLYHKAPLFLSFWDSRGTP